jgi:hypothetical protein
MDDNYLWDASRVPEAPGVNVDGIDIRDIQRLEALLGRFRTNAPAPKLPAHAGRRRTIRAMVPLLATAAAVTLMVMGEWRAVGQLGRVGGATIGWTVRAVEGHPQIDAVKIADTARIAVGQTLVTDRHAKALVDVSSIGRVTVDGGSRVRLVDSREGYHRLALDRGTLHAIITAPPGQFVVDTSSAVATDLGCAYTLSIDEEGTGLLSVSTGWVAFELNGRESFVPGGASCITLPHSGPGTPRFDDGAQQFRDALDRFDTDADGTRRRAALDVVLTTARERDAVTLWHLLSRVDASDRGRVFDALAARVAAPAGVTREAIARLDRQALDRWWDALGLGDTTWWRGWKRAYPDLK